MQASILVLTTVPSTLYIGWFEQFEITTTPEAPASCARQICKNARKHLKTAILKAY